MFALDLRRFDPLVGAAIDWRACMQKRLPQLRARPSACRPTACSAVTTCVFATNLSPDCSPSMRSRSHALSVCVRAQFLESGFERPIIAAAPHQAGLRGAHTHIQYDVSLCKQEH